jgi:hypothetical protein
MFWPNFLIQQSELKNFFISVVVILIKDSWTSLMWVGDEHLCLALQLGGWAIIAGGHGLK